MPNKKEDNLKHFTSDQSRDEAVKNGKKGGKASGKSRREKKALKDALEELLKSKLKDEVMLDNFKKFGFKANEMTMKDAISLAMIQQASKGNVQAYVAIRDTIGEKPSDKQEVDSTVHVVMDKDTEEFSG